MFRSRLFRGDLGALVLRSSNNAMRQLVAQGILGNVSWHKSIGNISFLEKPLLEMVASQIKPDNLVYALMSEQEYLLSRIERSRKALDASFFSLAPDEFIAHFRTLLCGKALVDLAYFPAQLDFGLGFHGTAFAPRCGDMLRAMEDERYNFLIPYYRQRVIPLFQAEQPGVVGISVTCVNELVPAFTLAHLLKKAQPQTHITLGGVMVTQLAQRIARNPALWDSFDSLILGPGEVAFSELIEQVRLEVIFSDAVPFGNAGESLDNVC